MSAACSGSFISVSFMVLVSFIIKIPEKYTETAMKNKKFYKP